MTNQNPADAVREALDDDDDYEDEDDMPRCECCLAICSHDELTFWLCDFCYEVAP